MEAARLRFTPPTEPIPSPAVRVDLAPVVAEVRALRDELRRLLAAPRPPERPDVYITYPDAGTKSVGIGTTKVDLLEGWVFLPDGTREPTSTSLGPHGLSHARSVLIEADQDIVVWLDTGGKYTITANEYIPLTHQLFRDVFIRTTAATSLRLWASSDPLGVPSKVVVPQITHLTAGSPVCRFDRYSGTSTSYVTVVTWTVPANTEGVLHEIALVAKDVASYAHAQWRITAGTVQLSDKPALAALTIPFPPNRLATGHVVKVEVKSDDGTAITVDASISGKTVP